MTSPISTMPKWTLTKVSHQRRGKKCPGISPQIFIKRLIKFVDKAMQDIQKSKDAETKFKEKDHSVSKLSDVEGSWLGSMVINGQNYWSHANPWPYKLEYFDNPLPSDSNFRLDVLYLRNDDEIKAQDCKVLMEESQRKDRKLREATKQKYK